MKAQAIVGKSSSKTVITPRPKLVCVHCQEQPVASDSTKAQARARSSLAGLITLMVSMTVLVLLPKPLVAAYLPMLIGLFGLLLVALATDVYRFWLALIEIVLGVTVLVLAAKAIVVVAALLLTAGFALHLIAARHELADRSWLPVLGLGIAMAAVLVSLIG